MKGKILLLPLLLLLFTAGCIDSQSTNSGPIDSSDSLQEKEVVMFKSPYCGCCVGYKEYLERNGYRVKVVELQDVSSIKEKYGIPLRYSSCHTTVFSDYFVEGHVPIEAINKLLSERPDIDGISLPGMPAGSPGMSGIKSSPFTILAIKDGEAYVFEEV